MFGITEQPLYWAVRGTVDGRDVCIVVEADSATEAEMSGWKRGIEVVIVNQATRDEVEQAKEDKRLWRYTPVARLRAFGRAVSGREAACLMLCGLWTALIHLHNAGLLPAVTV